MAGERHFDFGHEDADVIAAVFGRVGGYEGDFGKVDFFGQLLHERGRWIAQVDGQLIAGVFAADGEDVDDVEFNSRHGVPACAV